MDPQTPVVIDDSEPVTVVVENAPPPAAPEPPPPPAVVIAPEPSELETRMREMEGRLTLHDAQLVELRSIAESRAAVDHQHETPANLRSLSEHLDAMDTEDVEPKQKTSILRRKIF